MGYVDLIRYSSKKLMFGDLLIVFPGVIKFRSAQGFISKIFLPGGNKNEKKKFMGTLLRCNDERIYVTWGWVGPVFHELIAVGYAPEKVSGERITLGLNGCFRRVAIHKISELPNHEEKDFRKLYGIIERGTSSKELINLGGKNLYRDAVKKAVALGPELIDILETRGSGFGLTRDEFISLVTIFPICAKISF